MEQDCVLCGIPEERILESSEHCVVALFHNPQVQGHTVVAAKEHVALPSELDPDVLADAGSLLGKAYKRLTELMKVERCYVAVVGDRDHHFHFHLLPLSGELPVLGPYVFGPEGWAANAEKAEIPAAAEKLTANW
jgi:diadenosine tetraphosphate (Ap4A) HIT family hydrolase